MTRFTADVDAGFASLLTSINLFSKPTQYLMTMAQFKWDALNILPCIQTSQIKSSRIGLADARVLILDWRSAAISLGFVFLFATNDRYHSSWGVVLFPRSPDFFLPTFPRLATFFFKSRDHTFLYFHYWGYRSETLISFEKALCSSTNLSAQMMYCTHFALHCCRTKRNFK